MNSQVDQRIGLGYTGLNLTTLAESGENFKGLRPVRQ
jgi:hypothetical protein